MIPGYPNGATRQAEGLSSRKGGERGELKHLSTPKNGAKNLLQDVLYVFRALDVVVVEDLLSNLLAWGSRWSFTLCHSVTVLIFVYPSMGHKVDSCNTDLHKLFYTPGNTGKIP